jgi:hypothetical protein
MPELTDAAMRTRAAADGSFSKSSFRELPIVG